MGAATPRQLNAQSPDGGGDFHNQNFTLGRPIPKFHLEPPTPATYNNDERWRFGDSGGDDAAVQQCPPALPSRVTRNASSVERREHPFNVQNRYRNSMEDSSSVKSSWRDSDFQDDCDEDNRDPDYDLPRRNYDCDEDGNQTEAVSSSSAAFQDEEADEDDRDDDYCYPHFHYTLEGGSTSEGQFRSNPLTVVEETEGTYEDSYDYLPSYNRTSDRASTCRSSAQLSGNDSIFYDDRGIYDVPPIRDTSSIETGSRMSGIEAGLDDSGCSVYQNNDVFPRGSSSDIYDLPQQLQNPTSPLPVATNNSELLYSNGILPPLPEKRAATQTPHPKGDVEKAVAVEKRRVALPPPLPPSQSVSQTDEEHSYMNAGDVRMSGYSTCSSLDEGVYLPMTCGKASEIYTPMHSPDGNNVFKPVTSESSCDRSEEEARRSLDARELSQPQQSQPSANDHGPALIPIRFTANTRSFKRKTPSRGGSVTREDSLGSSAKHKENREPSPQSKVPPPIPPKTRLSKGSNYVHYASLDLESSSGDRPLSHLSDPPTSPSSGSFQSDTLYRTIDLEKTKALCELKKQTDDRQRNFTRLLSSEH